MKKVARFDSGLERRMGRGRGGKMRGRREMILYAISDGKAAEAGGTAEWARSCFDAGVDWVQIREKDLEAGDLLKLAVEVRKASGGGRVLVNERADVAAAAGLGGVHLPSDSANPGAMGRILGAGGLAGVSCHSLGDVMRATREGADFVVAGPVFETPSKRHYGPPLGLAVLEEICREAPIPVLALGGVNVENAGRCMEAGAAGVAGISLFRGGARLRATVEALRRL
jgi:thiamine-phosphate pyrophosphorylase